MLKPFTYDQALVYYRAIKLRYQAFSLPDKSDIEAEADVRESVALGLYEHWKSSADSPKFYIVHGVQIDVNTNTPSISYCALYPPHAGMLASRDLLDPENGFLSPISRPVYKGPRFNIITSLNRSKISALLDHLEELANIKNRDEFRQSVARLVGVVM